MTKLKDLNYHDGVVSNLEPDILECEDQVSLKKLCFKQSQWKGWNSAELFQNLEDDVLK